MNNSSDNTVGNCPFPQNFSHGLMTNGSAANHGITTNFGGPDVLTTNSNTGITFDVSHIDGAMSGNDSREYKMEQVDGDLRPYQLMGRTGNQPVEPSFPHSFYQIHPGKHK